MLPIIVLFPIVSLEAMEESVGSLRLGFPLLFLTIGLGETWAAGMDGILRQMSLGSINLSLFNIASSLSVHFWALA